MAIRTFGAVQFTSQKRLYCFWTYLGVHGLMQPDAEIVAAGTTYLMLVNTGHLKLAPSRLVLSL